MSHFGNAPTGGNASSNTGISGPQRDMWNQPIKQDKTPITPDPNNPNEPNLNDDGIDAKTIEDIWGEVKKENSTTTQQTIRIDNTPLLDPTKQLQDYMKSVGLDPITLTDAEKEDLKSGNFDNIIGTINQKIANAHIKAISSSKTMIDAAVEAAVTKAVKASGDNYAGLESVKQLNEALPFTKDKAIGPVARTVMQQLLNRGATVEQAIKGVDKWFKHTIEKADPTRSVNKNRNGNFQGAPKDPDNEGAESWLDILSPLRE